MGPGPCAQAKTSGPVTSSGGLPSVPKNAWSILEYAWVVCSQPEAVSPKLVRLALGRPWPRPLLHPKERPLVPYRSRKTRTAPLGCATHRRPALIGAEWQHMHASLTDGAKLAVVLDTGAVARGSGNAGSNRKRAWPRPSACRTRSWPSGASRSAGAPTWGSSLTTHRPRRRRPRPRVGPSDPRFRDLGPRADRVGTPGLAERPLTAPEPVWPDLGREGGDQARRRNAYDEMFSRARGFRAGTPGCHLLA